MTLRYEIGFKASDLDRAAELYDGAFEAKFALAIPDRSTRLALLAACFIPEFALSAYDDDELVGLAGFHTLEGSLTGGLDLRTLLKELGIFAGVRAALVFSIYDRVPIPGQLLMDGIVVSPDHRGAGIGTGLLERLLNHATDNGYSTVRLDVIDTNVGAKRLYERMGFEVSKTERFPHLRWLLGFGASSTMVCPLKAE